MNISLFEALSLGFAVGVGMSVGSEMLYRCLNAVKAMLHYRNPRLWKCHFCDKREPCGCETCMQPGCHPGEGP